MEFSFGRMNRTTVERTIVVNAKEMSELRVEQIIGSEVKTQNIL